MKNFIITFFSKQKKSLWALWSKSEKWGIFQNFFWFFKIGHFWILKNVQFLIPFLLFEKYLKYRKKQNRILIILYEVSSLMDAAIAACLTYFLAACIRDDSYRTPSWRMGEKHFLRCTRHVQSVPLPFGCRLPFGKCQTVGLESRCDVGTCLQLSVGEKKK